MNYNKGGCHVAATFFHSARDAERTFDYPLWFRGLKRGALATGSCDANAQG